MRIAVLSDIHGNSWALRAVLKDIDKKNPDLIINLGDSLYGPLDPKETFKLIKSFNILSISGNEDRIILENIDNPQRKHTLNYVISELNDEAFSWLDSLSNTKILECGAIMFHGTPNSDTTYLIEQLFEKYIGIKESDQIEMLLKGVDQKIIFCGHSHIPRFIRTPSRYVINSGSVGLPAYDDDLPIFHKIENFHNNAQYSIAELIGDEISVEQISIPYDYSKAVKCALKNNRPDWAKWINTGRA